MQKRLVLLLLAFALGLAWSGLTLRADGPVVRMFLFYSQTCPHCKTVLDDVLPPLLQKYGSQLEVRYFDIAAPENYQALLDLEKRFKVTAPDIPEVFVGERVLLGEEGIRKDLHTLIAAFVQDGGVDYPLADLLPVAPPAATAQPGETPTAAATETLPAQYRRLPPEGCKWCDRKTYGDKPIVYMAYFHDPACRECDRVAYDLNLLQSKYPNLYIRSFDLEENVALSEALGKRYGVPEAKRLVAPSVFVGEDYLVVPDINQEGLAALVEKYAASGSKPPWETVAEEGAKGSIIDRFRSFSVATVVVAGLLDGINPCAFAGLIFFISYLAIAKRKGREILIVGGAFTLGVFVSYLLVGLGILGFVRQMSFVRAISRVIYVATMVFCAVLASLSLYDYFQVRRGKKEDVTLRLPKPLQERLHRVIRQQSKVQNFAAAALVTGFVISLIEFACTGQVYLPTIIFVTGVPELRAHAVAYLVLYNLLFVTPLMIIFLLTFWGTTWRQLNRFLESNMAALKILTAGLFLLLAVWLGIYIF